jgi:hypothetical protein
MVVMVLSARSNFDRRELIRRTWGKGHDNVYFVVGEACPINEGDRRRDGAECELNDDAIENGVVRVNESRQGEYEHEMNSENDRLVEEIEKYGDIHVGAFYDVYFNLPGKLKSGYEFVLSRFPRVQYIVKSDDDQFVRVSSLEYHILMNSGDGTRAKLHPGNSQYWILGSIAYNTKLHTNTEDNVNAGKHVETRLSGKHKNIKTYPPWPKGSFGYVASSRLARYVVDNKDVLEEYQGEDTSMGLWIDDSPFVRQVKFVTSDRFSTQGNCWDNVDLVKAPIYYSVGHNLPEERVWRCIEALDEIKEVDRGELVKLKKKFEYQEFVEMVEDAAEKAVNETAKTESASVPSNHMKLPLIVNPR